MSGAPCRRPALRGASCVSGRAQAQGARASAPSTSPFSPVQSARKFSAVLGTMSEKSCGQAMFRAKRALRAGPSGVARTSITTRLRPSLAGWPPIVMSKKTLGRLTAARRPQLRCERRASARARRAAVRGDACYLRPPFANVVKNLPGSSPRARNASLDEQEAGSKKPAQEAVEHTKTRWPQM